MKWVEGRTPREPNKKLTAKKEYTDRNNISRICQENSPKVTDEPITKIICNQLDIKLGQLMQEGLDLVLKKLKIGKGQILMKYPQRMENKEIWRYTTSILQRCIQPEHNRKMEKELHLPFPQEGWPRNSQELPKYKPYVHGGQDLQCSATQLH